MRQKKLLIKTKEKGMELGTIVYNNKIYNLDYMTSEEIKKVLDGVEEEKRKHISQGKNEVHSQKDDKK